MNLKIYNWYGRLGNNILQVKHAIQTALMYNYNIILPYHEYFTTTYIAINRKINEKDPIFINDCFFFINKNKIDGELFDKYTDKAIDLIKSIFKIKQVAPLNDNDLVIHIRSGDIFSRNPHPNYIMPPLSYYINIIQSNHFDNITIIAQDTYNPCIAKLLALYPNIKLNIQSLDDDIKILLASRNVVESYGTFTYSILILSNNIKNVYKPSYQSDVTQNRMNANINIYNSDLEDYRKLLTPWKNTAMQRYFMTSYMSTVSNNKSNSIVLEKNASEDTMEYKNNSQPMNMIMMMNANKMSRRVKMLLF